MGWISNSKPTIVIRKMEQEYFVDITFENQDFTKTKLRRGDYEGCRFTACDFTEADLAGLNFMDCEFISCNWSAARLDKTGLKNVNFKDCKLLGLPFDKCSDFLFEVAFDRCQLNLSVFYKVKLKKTRFTDCSLHETDFTGADLTEAVFQNCDLLKATFDNTCLEKADLRTSFNYSIDPDMNRIKKAKFAMPAARGLLDKYDILVE